MLKARESFNDELFVSQVYDMSRPGEYSVQVAREIPKELGQGTVKSSTITLTLTQ